MISSVPSTNPVVPAGKTHCIHPAVQKNTSFLICRQASTKVSTSLRSRSEGEQWRIGRPN